MGTPRVLTDDELRVARLTWQAKHHKPTTLGYLCAVALNSVLAERKKSAKLQRKLDRIAGIAKRPSRAQEDD